MTTRSGTAYQREDTADMSTGDGEAGATEASDPGGRGDGGMTELLKLLLEDRRRRDDELAEERTRRERESREQEKRMTEQMGVLKALVERGKTRRDICTAERQDYPDQDGGERGCRGVSNYVRATYDPLRCPARAMGPETGSATHGARSASVCGDVSD